MKQAKKIEINLMIMIQKTITLNKKVNVKIIQTIPISNLALMQNILNGCDFTNLILKITELVDLDPEGDQEPENDLDEDVDKEKDTDGYEKNMDNDK
ncbi:hypothetical protein F8M41_021480 [Gigaspora margarita]|uniref:Uncharacterized protein n=1 Tax=Gigaspora margarita TaxID=4874 RepID=A0A8H4ETX1_GIGMA|nr:hypothetical protein F8M41_021480 [Gigaspora margarita]